MLRNIKAFTFIEVLFATSILFLSLAFVVPSFFIIHKERQSLYTELSIIQQLDEELSNANHHRYEPPYETSKRIAGVEVIFTVSTINETMRGCASWETNKEREKSTCLDKAK